VGVDQNRSLSVIKTERTPLGDRVRTEIRYNRVNRRVEMHITIDMPPIRLVLEPDSWQQALPERSR